MSFHPPFLVFTLPTETNVLHVLHSIQINQEQIILGEVSMFLIDTLWTPKDVGQIGERQEKLGKSDWWQTKEHCMLSTQVDTKCVETRTRQSLNYVTIIITLQNIWQFLSCIFAIYHLRLLVHSILSKKTNNLIFACLVIIIWTNFGLGCCNIHVREFCLHDKSFLEGTSNWIVRMFKRILWLSWK
jgi:hypothetical protein